MRHYTRFGAHSFRAGAHSIPVCAGQAASRCDAGVLFVVGALTGFAGNRRPASKRRATLVQRPEPPKKSSSAAVSKWSILDSTIFPLAKR